MPNYGTVQRAVYGVVKGAGKLEGFEPAESELKALPASTTNFDSGLQTIITCQPSVPINATPPQFPDGWSQCLITPTIKRKILSTPGYPKPLNRPTENRHRIARSPPSGGLGVFATVDTKAGVLIFSERAIMILSPVIRYPPNLPSHFTTTQRYQAALCQKEKDIEAVFGRLHEQHKEVFMALWNSHKEDGSGPLLGIVRTNSIEVDYYDDDDDMQFPYTGIWNEASRFNHRKVYSQILNPSSCR
ncbi:hypothetical protein E1B28_005635 [Marasmius oreades]|uniref:Uncharacterized protein n=1 Tax=Marasmius oreades TaxID=181124 RepID=A0A9P7S4A4_9AGAR|nr:uncharacterized protein E1B28_005635 [Marasmius oreades]KAG7094822.1 hypothetical protein E1B28_005635 [Marasmius oreades]